MRNRGIGRARMFVGGFLLAAAVIVWGTGILTNPRSEGVAGGLDHVRTAVVIYLRNSALATVGLCALAAVLLFPVRRPRRPRRDWAIGTLIAVMVLSSIYQLFWLQTSVLN